MTYYLQRGEIFTYKDQYLAVHPHLHKGLLPEYMLLDFDKHVKEGGVSLEDAFRWLLRYHILLKPHRTQASYRCNFRRFFLWIADAVGEQFHDCTDEQGCTIHYSLEDGILEWR